MAETVLLKICAQNGSDGLRRRCTRLETGDWASDAEVVCAEGSCRALGSGLRWQLAELKEFAQELAELLRGERPLAHCRAEAAARLHFLVGSDHTGQLSLEGAFFADGPYSNILNFEWPLERAEAEGLHRQLAQLTD